MSWQADVETALKTIPDTEVSFYMPDVMPEGKTVVSYRQAGQQEILADDAVYETSTEIYVDVFDTDPAKVAAVSLQVREKLRAIDFLHAGFSVDLYETETGNHHRSERYKRSE